LRRDRLIAARRNEPPAKIDDCKSGLPGSN
jgi:hypothetical protein